MRQGAGHLFFYFISGIMSLSKRQLFEVVQLYPWYYIPSSIHRILIHGGDIIKAAVLPIGMLSEEASESRNKDFKNYRQFNTRKISRTKTMEDLLNYLFISSEPIISTLSQNVNNFRKNITLDKEVIKLLAVPILLNCDNHDSSFEDSSEDRNSSSSESE